MKIEHNDTIRIKFEYNYNSCNWGYIADFRATKVANKLFIHSLCIDEKENPLLDFWKDDLPIGMNILQWEKIDYKGKPIWINCTGNEEWCNEKSTIKSIVKYHFEKINA